MEKKHILFRSLDVNVLRDLRLTTHTNKKMENHAVIAINYQPLYHQKSLLKCQFQNQNQFVFMEKKHILFRSLDVNALKDLKLTSHTNRKMENRAVAAINYQPLYHQKSLLKCQLQNQNQFVFMEKRHILFHSLDVNAQKDLKLTTHTSKKMESRAVVATLFLQLCHQKSLLKCQLQNQNQCVFMEKRHILFRSQDVTALKDLRLIQHTSKKMENHVAVAILFQPLSHQKSLLKYQLQNQNQCVFMEKKHIIFHSQDVNALKDLRLIQHISKKMENHVAVAINYQPLYHQKSLLKCQLQ